ncbi:Bug family tripartite tricarboxylate transporter substrate binding protein [Rhodoplanes sp. Z2-YC6860]|uniref:Bug family tripartite tricarboxylate transporter substrate binding protein n=1 Tax=Rhodoplanes sp. Z2-YC6860 TaxID=674703 RepID=UPI00078EA57B|nr:tripartite tricarboxylate transporter substrate binding protein [Rhodoplanes sp. Z2-YC6860]AMN41728.1 ABC transporter substrate-binding protein [Rhodoplanes sp. Z2-YC6860]
MLTRRRLIALSAAQVVAPSVLVRRGRAGSTDYPNKPVRFIVPVAAGGPTDIVARMLGEKLSKMWGQQVVVENKGGAGTNIGNEYVANAEPDGYTVLFATASLAVNTSLYRSLSYDPVADFAPVSLVTELAYFVFVPNSSPAHSMREFIDYARSRSGKLTIASPGTGSAPFLAEMLFLQMAGIQMTHIPYRGASPAFADLLPGRVDCYFGSGSLLSYARSGQVHVLGTTGSKRDAAAPDVPTIAESGVPGYDVTAWQALFVPAKSPPPIIRKISADTTAALADAEIKDRLAKNGYVAEGSSPEALGKLLKSEIAKWSSVIKSVGIKID